MDRGLGDSEMACGHSHCCAVFNDVHSQPAGSLLDGVCHNIPSDAVSRLAQSMNQRVAICISEIKY